MSREVSLLVIGLDGATFDLIEPWVREGELPHIAGLLERGASGVLSSTIPPSTFPAWTSFMTGMNPGKHGIFDFTRRLPGSYSVKFLSSRSRHGKSLFRILSESGLRVGVMGVPATYPPEELNGFMIAGFDSPVTTGIDDSFVHPRSLFYEIRDRVGPYTITDFSETRIGPGWHERALRKIHETLERKLEIARYLYKKERWDFFMVLFGESDTVGHHFWMFHDKASPRYDPARAAVLGEAIRSVYRKLDSAVGSLLELAGEDTVVMLVSDHGFGGSGDKVLHLNKWLAGEGFLRFRRERLGRMLYRAKASALRYVPSRLQEQLFRKLAGAGAGRIESDARFAFIDFGGTRVFSEEINYFPSFWINQAGRDPLGTVPPGNETERLKREVRELFEDLKDSDTGGSVCERLYDREEIYHGPFVGLAPDLVADLALDRGYSYGCQSSLSPKAKGWLRRLQAEELTGAKGGSMNGSHRREGIFVASGKGIRSGTRLEGLGIVDVMPTALRLFGLDVPEAVDGRIIEEAFD